MNLSKTLSDYEESALLQLRSLEKHFNQNPFDSSIIRKNQAEYNILRKYIGLTAGGLRRKELHRLKIDSHDFAYETKNNSCFKDLALKGWHQFQIDFKLLESFRAYIEQIPVKNYELAKDQNFQYLSLRLIPSSIYKNIQLYLGSKRLWIYPRNLLRSKSMKMDNLSAEQKSNLAFSFHRDIDSTASVKIFVNLRDSSDGAHEFIEASHSSTERSIGDNFLERLYSIKRFEQEFSAQSIYETFVWDGRFSKSSLNNLYPMGSLLQMPTFFGAAWVEDTYGLHRGTPCSSTNRCLLSISIGAHPIRVY